MKSQRTRSSSSSKETTFAKRRQVPLPCAGEFNRRYTEGHGFRSRAAGLVGIPGLTETLASFVSCCRQYGIPQNPILEINEVQNPEVGFARL
jgi:hypothetical protein